MHKNFNRILRCFGLVLLIAGCASSEPKLSTGWLDPGYKGPGFQKYFVVGLSNHDLSNNREFENQMVAKLIDAGVQAVPGWKYVPTNRQPDDVTMRAAVLKSGADAVLLARLSNFSTKSDEVIAAVPIQGYSPEAYGDTYGYAKQDNRAQAYVVGPTVISHTEATVHTTVFDVQTRSPVWSFSSPGFNPATLRQDIPVYINEVIENLLKARLLRP